MYFLKSLKLPGAQTSFWPCFDKRPTLETSAEGGASPGPPGYLGVGWGVVMMIVVYACVWQMSKSGYMGSGLGNAKS